MTRAPTRSPPAASSPTRPWLCHSKKSYLRQLAEQAKREYATRSIVGGLADGASLLSTVAGSVPGALTVTSSRSGLGGAASGAGEDEDKTSAFKGAEGGTDEPRYTMDYYSMETVGKRTFLRMLYSDVRPSEAARRPGESPPSAAT